VLRRTLLAGLLETLQLNRSHTPTAHVFEVGVVMRPEETPAESPLPAEKTRAAFALTGPVERASVHGGADRAADFFDGASVVEELLAALNVRGAEIVADEAPPWQPGLTAKVVRGDRVYGRFGVVHPSVAEAFELGGARVVAGELDLDALIADAAKTFRVVMPSRFPTIELDISMFVERRTTAGDVVRAIHGAGSPLLRGVRVLDVFEGSHIPAGSYSITARVELGSFERSLAMTEAQDERAKLVTALREKLGANVRE
jgi:phenylalanyl-tRNA synthetase beta chain